MWNPAGHKSPCIPPNPTSRYGEWPPARSWDSTQKVCFPNTSKIFLARKWIFCCECTFNLHLDTTLPPFPQPAIIKRWETQQFHRCKETESRILKRYLHTCVQSSIICKSQKAEATQVAMDRRMNKQKVVSIYDGTAFNLKKEGNPVKCYNMEKPWGYCAKSVSEKKQILWFHFHKVSRVVKFIEQYMKVVARGWGRGKWRVTVEWL